MIKSILIAFLILYAFNVTVAFLVCRKALNDYIHATSPASGKSSKGN